MAKNSFLAELAFNPIRDGPFRDCSRTRGRAYSKICHAYPAIMKIGTVIP